METDPALHHHLASGYRTLQPSLQTHQHQTQHHVQQHAQQHAHQHSVHHTHQHQQQHHSPHQGYAPHSESHGLDLSGLVNDEYHELQRLQVGHAHAHGFQQHAQSPFDGRHGHGHLQHEVPHTPEAHQQHQLVEHHQGHHPVHQEHHLAQNVQQQQQQEHTHPALRPYPLMHPSGEHALQQMHQQQQEDVFGSQTPMGASHTHTQGDAHLAPAPTTQLGDEKLQVDLDADGNGEKKFRVVPNPPDLEAWRQKLFDVDEMITLSEEEYYTYFPHVDNVYSHRSTQKYKRKPFVSHYWDCRLKGRPPGTKKSEDPEKKKRKRMARERDLCDVKIKITEFFGVECGRAREGEQGQVDGQMAEGDGKQGHGQESGEGEANNYYAPHTPQPPSNPNLHPSFQPPQPQQPPTLSRQSSSTPHPGASGPGAIHPGANGARYFTIQRVNGNGGNGKGDGVAGPHKHSLGDSDRIKKNSVIRSTLKESRELKRASGFGARGGSISVQGGGGGKKGGNRATGQAALTMKRHSKAVKDDGVTLFGDVTDISTHRVWIALEIWKLPYQFVEMEKGNIDERLREVCPRPETVKLPGLRKVGWGVCGERVVLEFLNEIAERQAAHSPLANPGLPAKFSGVAAGKRASSRPNPDNRPPASAVALAEKIGWAGEVASAVPTFDTLPEHPSATAHTSLLPPDPRDRAYARQWAAFVDEEILPAYDNYLSHSSLPAGAHSKYNSMLDKEREVGLEGQREDGLEGRVPASVYEKLQNSIIHLVAAAHPVGPFFAGAAMSYVDVVFAPIVIRIGMLLVGGQGIGGEGRTGRGWRAPEPGTRWESWVKALEADERVRATCCEALTYEAAWVNERARVDLKGGRVDGEGGVGRESVGI